LPVGTRAFRAVLASAFALALLAVVIHLVARKLVPRAHPLLASALAMVGALIATLAPSTQMEASAPAGSVLGALLVLLPLAFAAHGQTIAAACALGFAASYELDTFVCALGTLVLLDRSKRAAVAFSFGAL